LYAGYEGDASDADDDAMASATPSRSSCSRFPVLQTALLDFWLILRLELDKVHIFFQTRWFYMFWLLSVNFRCYQHFIIWPEVLLPSRQLSDVITLYSI